MSKIPAHRQAQLAIKRYIDERQLQPGDGLPPEAQLAKDIGISRLSLREGVKSLEAVGILEARQGEGLYVKAFTFDSIFENLPYSFASDGKSLRHLLQVRTALEEGLVGMLANKTTPSQLQELERLTDSMFSKARTLQTFEDEDREFHRVLYSPLDNPFLNRLVDLFWEVFHRLGGSADITLWHLEQTATDHQAIVEALKRGQPAQITAAMHAHFQQIRERLGVPDAAQPVVADLGQPRARRTTS